MADKERYNITLDYHGGHKHEEYEGVWVKRSLLVQAVRVVDLQGRPSKEVYTYPVEQHSSPEELVSQLRQQAELDKKFGHLESALRLEAIANQIAAGDMGEDLPGYEEGE